MAWVNDIVVKRARLFFQSNSYGDAYFGELLQQDPVIGDNIFNNSQKTRIGSWIYELVDYIRKRNQSAQENYKLS